MVAKIPYLNLFEKNDESFFKYVTNNDYQGRKTIIAYGGLILDKYPSKFFDTWIETYGVSITMMKSLILKMKTGNWKYTSLFCEFVEKKLIKNKIMGNVQNLIIKSKMYHLLSFIKIFYPEKKIPVGLINDLNVLEKLRITDPNNKNLNIKLISKNEHNVQKICSIISSTEHESDKYELIGRCHEKVLNHLDETNQIDLKNFKTVQKIFLNALSLRNVSLITYLLKYGITLTGENVKFLFGITEEIKKSKKLKKKICRRYRHWRRTNNPINKFKKIYKIKFSIYSNNYDMDLFGLLQKLEKDVLNPKLIKNIKLFIQCLFLYGAVRSALFLIKLFDNISIKLRSSDITSVAFAIIKTDDPNILKDVLLLKLIKTDKFVSCTNYLRFAIENRFIKIAEYMIESLKMKISSSDIMMRPSYSYRRLHRANKISGKNEMSGVDVLKFLEKHNMPINKSIIASFVRNGDEDGIKYCEETLKIFPTLSDLSQMFYNSYRVPKNAGIIFKSHFDKMIKNGEHPRIMNITKSLLSKGNNSSMVFSVIKHITKNRKMKSESIINLCIENSRLNALKYFHEVKKIPIDITGKLMSNLCQEPRVNRYNYYRRFGFRGQSRDIQKKLKIFQYLKDKCPDKFEIFKNEYIKNKENISKLLHQNRTNDSITERIDTIESIFGVKIGCEHLLSLLDSFVYLTNEYIVRIHEKIKFSDELVKKLLSYNPGIVMCQILTQLGYDMKKYLTIKALNASIEVGVLDNSYVSYIIEEIGIKPTPYSYSLLALSIERYKNIYMRPIPKIDENNSTLKLLIIFNKSNNKMKKADYDKFNETFSKLENFTKLKFKLVDKYEPLEEEKDPDHYYNDFENDFGEEDPVILDINENLDSASDEVSDLEYSDSDESIDLKPKKVKAK